MTNEETAAFTVLDRYSRQSHKCFVAEMFPRSDTVYKVCFRPVDVGPDSISRFLCEYIDIRCEDIVLIAAQNSLPPLVRNTLDTQLASLQRRKK